MKLTLPRDRNTVPTAQPLPRERSQRRVALLVGVNTYPNDRELTPLQYAESDARAMARQLEACGFEVILLLGPEATEAAVSSAIRRYGQLGGSLFLFYFAGHGQLDMGNYLLHTINSDAAGLGTLSFDTLARQWHSEGFRFDRVLSILDACRSQFGGHRGGVPLSADACNHISAATEGAKRVEVIFGCRQGQVCYESEELGHGWLTAGLLPAFQNSANYLTTQMLAGRANDFMRRWSAEEAKQRKKSRVQQLQHYAAPSIDDPFTLVDRDVGLASLAQLPKPATAARQQVRHLVVPRASAPAASALPPTDEPAAP
jgi:uncharacterized caspase-like protein